jgi:SAM-dependent methyltransferase
VYAGTVQGLGSKLKNDLYDVITAFQIIEHERDPLSMMKRIHNLLKSDGMVILATPNYGGCWRKVMGKRWFGFRHPEHVVLFNFNSMRILLEKAGFRDIEIRKDTPRPFPLSFAFSRGADYFPFLGFILKPIGKLLDGFKITNPINPWDDMIAFARK